MPDRRRRQIFQCRVNGEYAPPRSATPGSTGAGGAPAPAPFFAPACGPARREPGCGCSGECAPTTNEGGITFQALATRQ